MLRIGKILLAFDKIEKRFRKTSNAIIELKEVVIALKRKRFVYL